jgi:alkyl hydroperoxide reductase subunit D
MTLEALIDSLPAYADDIKLNWRMTIRQPELTPLQLWGTALASAAASRNRMLVDAVAADAALRIEAPMLDRARAAMAIMSTSNIYHRFVHLVEREKYSTIPSHLRTNAARGASADFELWCVAVSAINGCGACIQAHERAAREKRLTEETVLAAVRVAAVIHAAAVVLDNVN